MFCCGLNNLKHYIKNYIRTFDTADLDTNTDNVHDFSDEWENISTPRGQ